MMSSVGSDFPSTFSALISWFTFYYFLERLLRSIAFLVNPISYEKLRASRRDLVFFGIAMGLLITLFSTPLCAYAALDAWKFRWSPMDHPRDQWQLETHTTVCMMARGILWVSELNRLDMYGLYVLHHAGSILALLSWIHFRWPNSPFLTLFTTLGSEIPGDLFYLVSEYRETVDGPSPKLDWFKIHLRWFNAVQYTLIRGGGILAVSWMLWSNISGIQDRWLGEQLYAYSLLGLYSAFCASYVLRQYRSIQRKSGTSINASRRSCRTLDPAPNVVDIKEG